MTESGPIADIDSIRDNRPEADVEAQLMTPAAATQALHQRWWVFGPMWLVSIAWPILGLTAETFGHGRAFFWLYLPVFFIAFFLTVRRTHVHRIPNGQAILLATLVPFIMAVIAGGLWHLAAAVIRLAVD